jgi:hypothetical protein
VKTISAIRGLHGMLGLPDHILVAAASDSIESLPSCEATNKFGASFETPSGRRLVGNLVLSFFSFQGCMFVYIYRFDFCLILSGKTIRLYGVDFLYEA